MAEPDFIADPELQKVLEIAAYVGEIGQDEVNISYTSLMAGMMWSDDATSRWLQEKQKQLGVNTQAIYSRRKISGEERDRVLANIAAGRHATTFQDYYSVSAKTVLREA